MHACMHACLMYVCMNVYMYAHIHIYIYTYIHMHTQHMPAPYEPEQTLPKLCNNLRICQTFLKPYRESFYEHAGATLCCIDCELPTC